MINFVTEKGSVVDSTPGISENIQIIFRGGCNKKLFREEKLILTTECQGMKFESEIVHGLCGTISFFSEFRRYFTNSLT